MKCSEARRRLGGERAAGRRLADHLETCSECARIAARWRAAGELLQDHHAGLEPSPGFAARVVGELPAAAPDALGWAALRMMPAALALALALAAWCVVSTPTPAALLEVAPTEAPLEWLLLDSGEAGG